MEMEEKGVQEAPDGGGLHVESRGDLRVSKAVACRLSQSILCAVDVRTWRRACGIVHSCFAVHPAKNP